MSPTATEAPQSITLADRLREAPLTVPVAIRYALQLADALRQAHDMDLVSGVIDPERIVFSAGEMAIHDGRAPEAYVAPEVLDGRPADARSDVFVFGCVLYRLLTGREAFPGSSVDSMRESVLNTEPAALTTVLDTHGQVRVEQFPGLERLLRQCLAKDPEQRLQRMQKVYLELKLLRVGARRPDASAAARRERSDAELRNEIGRVEHSLTLRVETCERSLTEARAAQDSLRASATVLEQSVAALRDAAARLETGLEETARTTGSVEEALSSQLTAMEERLHHQGDSVEALRTAVTQTDDLLERVVEAFDSLQAYVTEQFEDKAPAPHA